MAYKVAVVGAAGYAGAELVRLLLNHPDFEVVAITSQADAGKRLSEVYPAFVGACELVLTNHDDPAVQACDVAFLAVPHTAALSLAPRLLQAGVTVIDLSADFRLSDPEVYECWYNTPHTALDLLKQRIFGQPELFFDQLVHAAKQHAAGHPQLIACAGCYPTATSLATAPAVALGWMAPEALVVVDAISGVSGAGKGAHARTHFCSASDNLEAYGVGTHRHTPEIEQILELPGRVVFTPHLAPLSRGLLSTVTIPLAESAALLSTSEMVDAYRGFYEGHSFVRVLDAGIMPRTDSVAGSNVCQIGLQQVERTKVLVVTAAIDNLCKGAAGQAVQCANIVFGLDERRGLPQAGLPV